MEKFVLNITASSGEFFQGECESLTLPTADGQYGVQAGHSPVLEIGRASCRERV